MERFLWMVQRTKTFVFDVRVLYVVIGIIISLCAHELVHVLLHLGSIDAVHFLPNAQTVMAMSVGSVDGISINNEEFIAYGVMVLIQFVVVIDVFAIHDSRDKKTVEQTLFGNRDELSKSESSLLLQLISK